jgi:hypothetical protein
MVASLALAAVPGAALLPDSIGPYLALMALGFVLGAAGHVARARWLVAVGVIMIFLATLLFPIALQLFSDEPEPPGQRVPIAGLGGVR